MDNPEITLYKESVYAAWKANLNPAPRKKAICYMIRVLEEELVRIAYQLPSLRGALPAIVQEYEVFWQRCQGCILD